MTTVQLPKVNKTTDPFLFPTSEISSLTSAELSWLLDRTVLTDRAVLTSSVIEAADDLAFFAEKLRSRSSDTEPRRLLRPVSVLAEARASLAVATLLAESKGRGLGETEQKHKEQ